MKMDGNSSDQSSPLSDNVGGTWSNCWETGEDCSLHIGPEETNQLHNLVEDKEIAARAVAFVVNSTRKGIVPLCSDVASLLRLKRNLEARIFRLKNENAVLRSSHSGSMRTSTSTSPIPVSVNSFQYSDRGSLPEQPHTTCLREKCSPTCSRCSSQCSSLLSNSPRLPDKCYPQRSPRLHRTSAFSVPNSRFHEARQHVTVALVHDTPSLCSADDLPLTHSTPETSRARSKGHERKNSLPEIISEPHGSVPKVSPRVTQVSTEVQCSLDASSACSEARLEEQFRQTLQINTQLSEELQAANKKIEVLRGKVKELEMKQLAHQSTSDQKFYIENEHKTKTTSTSSSSSSTTSASQGCCPYEFLASKCTSANSSPSPTLLPAICSAANSSLRSYQGKLGNSASHCCQGSKAIKGNNAPVVVPPPLGCCCCALCEKAGATANSDRAKVTSPRLKKRSDEKKTCASFAYSIGDHVLLEGQRTGHIRYIGHLEETAGHSNMVFAGIEIDAPVGCHDGILDGKRYFHCEKNSGLFVPLHEIIGSIHKKTTVISSTSNSGHSSDSKPAAAPQRNTSDCSSASVTSSAKKMLRRTSSSYKDPFKDGKDKRFVPPESRNLKLPKNFTNGQLV